MDLFEVKLKYVNSEVKKVSESYIIEAFNYTDAEAIIVSMVSQYGMMDAEIKSMKPVKYADIVDNPNGGDLWFKVTASFITVNDNGSEKAQKFNYLVQCDDMDGAITAFKNYMKGTASDWTSVLVQKTAIVEVVKKPLK